MNDRKNIFPVENFALLQHSRFTEAFMKSYASESGALYYCLTKSIQYTRLIKLILWVSLVLSMELTAVIIILIDLLSYPLLLVYCLKKYTIN